MRGLHKVEKGDALIFFRRSDIILAREIFQSLGHLIPCCIYGALSPKVRAAEAKRFRTGEADIILATDAIGMGLNLGSIKRVLFASTKKYNGECLAVLPNDQILQIGGRAARGDCDELGFVGAVKFPNLTADPSVIVAAFEHGSGSVLPNYFYVFPSFELVQEVGKNRDTKSVSEIFQVLNNSYRLKDDFKICVGKQVVENAEFLDRIGYSMEDTYLFSQCPASFGGNAYRSSLGHYFETFVQCTVQNRRFQMKFSAEMLGGSLQDCEDGCKVITLYLWFSQRWPDLFPDSERAISIKRFLNQEIEKYLCLSWERRSKTPEQIIKDVQAQFAKHEFSWDDDDY